MLSKGHVRARLAERSRRQLRSVVLHGLGLKPRSCHEVHYMRLCMGFSISSI